MSRPPREYDERLMAAIVYAMRQGADTPKAIFTATNMERWKVSQYLNHMLDIGMLTKDGHGRGVTYSLAASLVEEAVFGTEGVPVPPTRVQLGVAVPKKKSMSMVIVMEDDDTLLLQRGDEHWLAKRLGA